ncbi:hypothetical protein C9374_011622 [Naegleria lovaniensis]|uniref:Ankyrin repeat domain-containing protein n=1 Tax=Naegleria lovaniensis TaxID=51637 RepID=A0AA88KII3_NAELO|nr:uncharacterized protein C9374_011622 [Naegleria lovaniensis]KAG2373957.1 hypothetical protein C9374_011622 [Naegleria lovaniensis]
MARTRGGSRVGMMQRRPRIYEHPNNFQKFNGWIERNDQSKHTDLLSHYAPYSHCSKLARLWILKDINNKLINSEEQMKNQTSNSDTVTEWATEVALQKLRELPMDAKAYIICFISTNSWVTKSYNNFTSILEPKKQLVIDPWWMSYLKHRVICHDVKQVLENTIATRISREGLDLSDYITYGTNNKYYMILSLLGAHQELMTLGRIEQGFIPYSQVIVGSEEDTEGEISYAVTLQSDEDNENPPQDDSTVGEDELMVDILQSENHDELEKELVTLATDFGIGALAKPPLRKYQNQDQSNIANVLTIHRNAIDLYRNVYYQSYYGGALTKRYHRENQYIHTLTVPLTSQNVHFIEILFQNLKGLKNLTILSYYPRGVYTIFSQLLNQQCTLSNIENLKFVNLSRGYISGDMFEKLTTVCKRISNLQVEGFGTSRFVALKRPEHTFEMHTEPINASMLDRMMQTYEGIEPYQVDGSSLLRSIFIDDERSLLEKKSMIEVILKKHSLEHFNWAQNTDLYSNTIYLPLLQYALYLNNRYWKRSFGKQCTPDFAISCIEYGHDIMNNMLEVIPLLPSELAEQVINGFLKDRLMNGQFILTVEQFRELLLNILGNQMIGTFLPAFSTLRGFVKDVDKLFKNFEVTKFGTTRQLNLFHYLLFVQAPTFIIDYLIDYLSPEDLLEITSVPVLLLAIPSLSISDIGIVKMIKKQPLILNQKAKGTNLTALHLACSDCRRWSLIPLLVNECNEDVHSKDANGNTPYDYAKSQCDGFERVIPACLKQ